MIDLEVLGAMLLLAVAGTGITFWLVRRMWKRASSTGKLVASLVAVLAMSGAFGTLVGLIKAFGAVGGESVDPSQQARILVKGSSEAVNYAAFSFAVWVPSVIAALVITRRREGAAPRA